MAIELKTISGKLANDFRPINEPSEVDFKQRSYEIIAALQTSLEIEQAIKTFTNFVTMDFLISGVIYHHEENNISLKFGVPTNQKCTYNLTIEGESLGQITFMRRKRFSDQTLEQLENLLCSLVYPLRNCLTYRKALELSQKDALTGAFNRGAMNPALDREVGLAQRQNKPFSVIMLDIDFFKHVNDTYGHAAGDYVLQSFVQIVNDTIRSIDSVFRFGGEEFAVHLHNTDEIGAKLLAERIRLNVESTIMRYKGSSIPVTVSSGIATLEKIDNGQSLMERADKALYQAKNNGRNQVQAS
ncbi:MAG: GGDEF domain-containing protein [Methylococcales bacterium]|jgi:diguanylate cyclase (GGDEF)-like protein|nr:GGDEF domain-containing protein [Methylococcales bacterium]